jgi:hypothetical protein
MTTKQLLKSIGWIVVGFAVGIALNKLHLL